MSTLEQRMTKAESLSALVNSPAMGQPLPSSAPTGESKSSLFGQLKEAIAVLGPGVPKMTGGAGRGKTATGPKAVPAGGQSGGANATANTAAHSLSLAQANVSSAAASYDSGAPEDDEEVGGGMLPGPTATSMQSSALLPETAILGTVAMAQRAGGFHSYYLGVLQKEMKDVACKNDVEFLCRVLDGIFRHFDPEHTHELVRSILARILAVKEFDRSRNLGYFAVMAPRQDSLFDADTLQSVAEAVVKHERTQRQLAEHSSGGKSRRRNRNRGGGGGGGGGGGWQQQGGGRPGAGFQQQGGRGRVRGGRGGGPQAASSAPSQTVAGSAGQGPPPP